jgi:hypothetical protein
VSLKNGAENDYWGKAIKSGHAKTVKRGERFLSPRILFTLKENRGSMYRFDYKWNGNQQKDGC